MFDQHYPFHFIMTERPEGELYQKLHIYTFQGPHQQQYTVHVEVYPMDLYAINFYLQAHSASPHKFQLLTGYFQAPRIIKKCIEVFLALIRNNNEASLCFIGTNEVHEETKRFRVYRSVMQNFFSPQYFEHRILEEQSLYFMLNKRKDIMKLNQVITDIMEKYSFE